MGRQQPPVNGLARLHMKNALNRPAGRIPSEVNSMDSLDLVSTSCAGQATVLKVGESDSCAEQR